MKSIKAIFRRGQNAKIDGQNQPDNLSRTSSITNLDADQRLGKGAKPRKSASRDRIDKINDGKKNDKKGVTKNNNKLDSGESPYPSIDSLQEEEFLQLRRQLQEMAQEKTNLALQLGEQKGQLNILQKEIQSLKSFQEESNVQLENLTEENSALRKRLRDVAHSPLSDNEKQQLLYETHQRHHSSAPASIATNLVDEGNGGDITACPTPDWDKHSSSNVSEVSVACLQDKINQMQETHYSTNEELQATLQELTDLQRQLTELQQENERLNEEKTLMFDSLCRQTERLNDSRAEVESLKQLLYREKDETGQYESAIEREQKLVGLLKSAQEEKQALLLKLDQINNEIQEARAGILEKDERITQLSERVRTLESTLDAKHAEHKLIDQELAQAKDQCSGKQIEINRLTDLLDNARTKIVELEQDRALSDKSELDELLDNARKEKDALESEVAHLKEQLAIGKNEIEKLKEQVSILQEECKVTRNNARTTQCDLEYKCEKLLCEKNNLNDQLLEFQEAINELQVQSQCQLEDKRQLSAVLSETQRNLSESERKNLGLETELQELKKVRTEEVEEWEKFQNDLLTSVRVANDFKTEAQQELQRMIMENKSYREKERQLKTEIDKLKGDKKNRKEESLPKPKLNERSNSSDMENLLGLSRRSRDKPRKGRDNVDAAVAPKEDKAKEKKPEVLPKPVKRREKPTSRSKKNKTLSVEEELLLKSLNDWYENIDKNLPEDKLTEEQRVIRKLKTLYEDDSLKERPVAHKPKNQLAISKPLLDSVFLNPKLEEIAKDPNMPTIEETESFELLSDGQISPVLRNLPEIPDRREQARSVDYMNAKEEKRVSVFGRSRSYDDVFNLDEKCGSPLLYRSTETDDLRKEVPLVQVQRESSILPSDSVSNPRYSDFSVVVDSDVRAKHKHAKRSHEAAKVSRNSSVSFESLESVLASIPENVPEGELNSEQKFALRLKKALDEAERKNTLKKVRRSKRVDISAPTADSVEKNAKLRDILLDPQIQSVRRNSDTDNGAELSVITREPVRQSKSCQDISFSFNRHSNRPVDYTESMLGDSYGFNRKSSLTDTFSSAELDAEPSVTLSDDLKNFTSFKEETIENKIASPVARDESDEVVDNFHKDTTESHDQDLLYNETLNKNKKAETFKTFEERVSLQEATQSLIVEVAEEIVLEKDEDKVNEVINDDKKVCQDATDRPFSSKTYKVLSADEDEVDISKYVVITAPEEYATQLQEPQHEDNFSDLTYNETMKKKSILKQPKEEFIVIEDNYTNAWAVPDIIVDLTKENELITDSITKDELYTTEDLDSEKNVSDLGYDYSDASTGYREEENLEYDYHAVLRENKYGVISPLKIRLSYKDVVKEFKNKFSSSNESDVQPEDDGLAQRNTFMDDFYGSTRVLDEVSSDVSTSNDVNEIDAEMEKIFERYLRTPVSRVITQVRSEEDDSKRSPIVLEDEYVVREELTSATNFAMLVSERDDEKLVREGSLDSNSIEEIVLIIDHKQRDQENVETERLYDSSGIRTDGDVGADLTLQEIVTSDLGKENVETKVLHDSSDVRSDQGVGTDVTLEEILPSDLDKENVETKRLHDSPDIGTDQDVGTDLTLEEVVTSDLGKETEKIAREEEVEQIVESVNKNLSFISNTDKGLEPPKQFEIDETDNALSEDELELLRSVSSIRFSRPLSDFNQKDLDMIERLSARYLTKPEKLSVEVTKEELCENDDVVQCQIDDVEKNKEIETGEDVASSAPFDAVALVDSLGQIEEEENDFQDEKGQKLNSFVEKNEKVGTSEDVSSPVLFDSALVHSLGQIDEEDNDLQDEKDQILNRFVEKNEEVGTSEVSSSATFDSALVHSLGQIEEEEYDLQDEKGQILNSFVGKNEEDETSEDVSSSVLSDSALVDSLGQNEEDNDVEGERDRIVKSFEEACKEDSGVEVNSETDSIGTLVTKDSDPELKEPEVNQEIKKIEDIGEVINRNSYQPEKNEVKKIDDSSTILSKIDTIPNVTEDHEIADAEADKFKDESRDYSQPDIISSVSNSDNIFGRSDPKYRTSEQITNHQFAIAILEQSADTHSVVLSTEDPKPVGRNISSIFKIDRPTAEYKIIRNTSVDDKAHSKPDNTDEDDMGKLLTKITPNTSRKPVKEKDIEFKDGKPKVIMRNADYGSVKSKLEYFSKRSAENRQSLDIPTPDRRKVRSWAEHFERRSLDTHSTYEPVYANLQTVGVHKSNSALSAQIEKKEKKPLPVPRSRNQGGALPKNDDTCSSDIRDDVSVNGAKMSDCKIISENETESLSQEHPDCNSIGRIKLLDVPVYSETSKVILETCPKGAEDEGNARTSLLGVKKSEKFLEMHGGGRENEVNKEEEQDLASGAESSFSSIAVAGKFEQLDITRTPDDMEEISTVTNESHLNLFHLETPSYDESYLSLFKSPEDKVYEDISGAKRPQKGYFNFAYLGELSDNDSFEEMNSRRDMVLEGTDSKPKIIDFVPLDDGTEPVFKKDLKEPIYDTLEREKTFHVLNLAASTGAVKKSASSPEHRNAPAASGSRMSFSAAKKVFETLLESNLDNEKSKLKRKESQEKTGEIETRASSTAVKDPL